MIDRTTNERLDFVEDKLAELAQLVKVSFIGTARELDALEERQHNQDKIIREFSDVVDIHFELIKEVRKESKENSGKKKKTKL